MERNENFNFSKMNIPVGSTLQFVDDSNITVKVIGERKVEYENQESYLTPVTQKLLKIEYAVDPTEYWYYNNRKLKDYYIKRQNGT
jgi:hypothetical protein